MRRTLSVCLSVRHVIVATGPAVVAKQQRLCRPQRGTEGRISYGHLGHTDSCLSRCEADALFVRGEQVVGHGLRVDFDTVLMFFKKGLPFADTLDSSHFHCQVAPQFAPNSGSDACPWYCK